MGKKSRYVLVIISVLIMISIGLYSNRYKLVRAIFKEVEYPEFQVTKHINDMLSKQEMKEDLNQLKKDIEEVHPKTKDGLSEEMKLAFEQANKLIEEPMAISDFSIITSEIVCMLQDAHTSVNGLYSRDLNLPMKMRIVDDKFYIISGKDLEPKDKLVSLGGVPIEDIYERVKKRIPAENIYWLNRQFRNLLPFESTLIQMGAEIEDKQIEVVVNRDGDIITIPMKFGDIEFRPLETTQNAKKYKTYPVDGGYNTQFLYYIDKENDLCHFILKSCHNTPEYRKFLEVMFKDIKENNITNIAVDLRGNTGGNSMVINEFLRYIDVEQYKTFGVTRRLSEQAAEQRSHIISTKGEKKTKPSITKNKKIKEFLFGGDVYALTDDGTFSAASDFATILKDNEIGTLIGEPTGNAPNSYGDILFFQMKNSELLYNISYSEWIRPEKGKRDDYALYPDIQVSYGIDDYIEGRDLVMEKLLEVIGERISSKTLYQSTVARWFN